MSKLTSECRDKLVETLAKELDTRDKRFMFLKCQFPSLVSRINLEGSPINVGYEIYWEFEKQRMLGSLMASINNVFDSELDFLIDG